MRSVEASDRLAQPFGRLDVKGLREIGIKPQKALVVSSLLWSPASKLGHRAFSLESQLSEDHCGTAIMAVEAFSSPIEIPIN